MRLNDWKESRKTWLRTIVMVGMIVGCLGLVAGCQTSNGKPKIPDKAKNFQTGSRGEVPTKVFNDYDWIILSIDDYKWSDR